MAQEDRKVGRFEDGMVLQPFIGVTDAVIGALKENILLQLKAVEQLLPIHQAQVITYLRLSRLPVGLLANFDATVLRNGLRRLTPNHPKSFRSSGLPVRSK